MIKIILTVGGIASGKSTWAISEVKKNPTGTVRINRDSLRVMLSDYTFSDKNEKLVSKARQDLLVHAVKAGYNIILDETNINRDNFTDVCKTVEKLNADVTVMEKPFYVDLNTALARNAQREGHAKIPEEIVHKFWKKLGGVQHQHYKPRVETFYKRTQCVEGVWTPMVQDETLPPCAIFDLDGTMCNISHRNPYDPSTCDKDGENKHVVDLCKLLYNNGHKILFFSGRDDIYEELTRLWLDTYFGGEYSLHMRETGNREEDSALKERLFNTHVKGKFYCKLWVDDRLRVCKFIHEAGLPLFRVGSPTADF